MARRRQSGTAWLDRATYKYQLILLDPDGQRLLKLWEEVPAATRPHTPGWDEAEALARTLAGKYRAPVTLTALRTTRETGRPSGFLNPEWPLAFTVNEGHVASTLFAALRLPGERGPYFGPWALGNDPHDSEEHAPVVSVLRIDIDLTRLTVWDLEDLAGEFRALLRQCRPFALRARQRRRGRVQLSSAINDPSSPFFPDPTIRDPAVWACDKCGTPEGETRHESLGRVRILKHQFIRDHGTAAKTVDYLAEREPDGAGILLIYRDGRYRVGGNCRRCGGRRWFRREGVLRAVHPRPDPRSLTVRVNLGEFTGHDPARLARDFSALLRTWLPRTENAPRRAPGPLDFLRTVSPTVLARDLRRYQLHTQHGLSYRLIAALEAGERGGRPIPPAPRPRRVGLPRKQESSVEESVKRIYRAIHRTAYRARHRGASGPPAAAEPYTCARPGHRGGNDCDAACLTWMAYAARLRLEGPEVGQGAERVTRTGTLPEPTPPNRSRRPTGARPD